MNDLVFSTYEVMLGYLFISGLAVSACFVGVACEKRFKLIRQVSWRVRLTWLVIIYLMVSWSISSFLLLRR